MPRVAAPLLCGPFYGPRRYGAAAVARQEVASHVEMRASASFTRTIERRAIPRSTVSVRSSRGVARHRVIEVARAEANSRDAFLHEDGMLRRQLRHLARQRLPLLGFALARRAAHVRQ